MFRKIMAGMVGLAAVFFLARGLWAQHGGGGPMMIAAPAMLEVPSGGISLPMQDVGGRPVVDVKINGKGPYRFILDTGASGNVIDTALQDELSLPKSPMTATFPGHGTSMTLVSLEELSVGEAKLGGLTAVVMHLDKLFTGDGAPRGVLSASAFPGHVVTFDYPKKRIGIAKGKLDTDDAKRTFAYSEDDVLPTVPVRIGGREVRVHLDTGSGYGLILPRHYLDELPLASQPVDSGQKTRTPMGEYPIKLAKLKGPVALGDYALDLGDVRFSDASPGGPPRGNLGYEVLRGFVVTLDSRNRRVRLER
jgi:aspartyl protease